MEGNLEANSGQAGVATKPAINIFISENRMRAYIEITSTSTNTLAPEISDMRAAIKDTGIVRGVNEKLLIALCQKPQPNVQFEFAQGEPAKKGEDGRLNYFIPIKKELKPKINDDGTVDYHDIGFVQNVKIDEPLCEVHHATKGGDGYDIYGGVLDGIMGKEPSPPCGKNTRYDEAQSLVLAAADGNVVVDKRGIINVFDVLKIETVDNSTGDIKFSGDVIVSGDVASGFKIDAGGDIMVKGTVEGAVISAGGDVFVGTAINGMDTAKIKAGGSLKCKYIQNCGIETGGDIYADSIMYCQIECNGSIELSGKRGGLIGGKTVIAKTLAAKTIGTESHVPTHVTMIGGSIGQSKKLAEVKKEVGALDTELVSIVQTISWCTELLKNGQKLKLFQKNAFESARNRLSTIQSERGEKIKELEAVQNAVNNIDPAKCYIHVSGRVHSGARLVFGTQIMQVNASFANSRVYLKGGEIGTSPL